MQTDPLTPNCLQERLFCIALQAYRYEQLCADNQRQNAHHDVLLCILHRLLKIVDEIDTTQTHGKLVAEIKEKRLKFLRRQVSAKSLDGTSNSINDGLKKLIQILIFKKYIY